MKKLIHYFYMPSCLHAFMPCGQKRSILTSGPVWALTAGLLVLLAFVGCTKQTDEEKCEEEEKVWVAERSECITKKQKECEDANQNYNEQTKECEAKSNAQLECEQKQPKHQWKDGKCEPVPAGGGTTTGGPGASTSYTVLFKNKGSAPATEVVSVNAGGTENKTLFKTGECATVTSEQMKKLKISAGALGSQVVLCGEAATPCEAKNYEIIYQSSVPGGAPNYILKSGQAANNCKALLPL